MRGCSNLGVFLLSLVLVPLLLSVFLVLSTPVALLKVFPAGKEKMTKALKSYHERLARGCAAYDNDTNPNNANNNRNLDECDRIFDSCIGEISCCLIPFFVVYLLLVIPCLLVFALVLVFFNSFIASFEAACARPGKTEADAFSRLSIISLKLQEIDAESSILCFNDRTRMRCFTGNKTSPPQRHQDDDFALARQIQEQQEIREAQLQRQQQQQQQQQLPYTITPPRTQSTSFPPPPPQTNAEKAMKTAINAGKAVGRLAKFGAQVVKQATEDELARREERCRRADGENERRSRERDDDANIPIAEVISAEPLNSQPLTF